MISTLFQIGQSSHSKPKTAVPLLYHCPTYIMYNQHKNITTKLYKSIHNYKFNLSIVELSVSYSSTVLSRALVWLIK